jgi:hypothetical protein
MIDTSILDQIIHSNIPNLKSNLTILNDSLTLLYNATGGASNPYPGAFLLHIYPANYTPALNQVARDTAALIDFRSRLVTIFRLLDSLILGGGNLDKIINSTIILKTSMTNINSTAKSIIVNVINLRTLRTPFLDCTI